VLFICLPTVQRAICVQNYRSFDCTLVRFRNRAATAISAGCGGAWVRERFSFERDHSIHQFLGLGALFHIWLVGQRNPSCPPHGCIKILAPAMKRAFFAVAQSPVTAQRRRSGCAAASPLSSVHRTLLMPPGPGRGGSPLRVLAQQQRRRLGAY
jgi:hypothetical protein